MVEGGCRSVDDDGDDCLSTCRLNVCGDGFVHVGHQGEIELIDDQQRVVDRFRPPYGTTLKVTDGQQVEKGAEGAVAHVGFVGGSGRLHL